MRLFNGAGQSGRCERQKQRHEQQQLGTHWEPQNKRQKRRKPMSNGKGTDEPTRVACLGNSIQYYNDCPRLLEALSEGSITQDSCLRVPTTAACQLAHTLAAACLLGHFHTLCCSLTAGSIYCSRGCCGRQGGTSLRTLLEKGNGMKNKWSTPNALCAATGTYNFGAPTIRELLSHKWNFVILNDFTQHPARIETRTESLTQLQEHYAAMLQSCEAVPIFMSTPAYRAHTKGSDDLGDHAAFTQSLMEGYESYASALAEMLPASQRPRVAPVAPAFLIVRDERPQLWEEMFQDDDYHPSPIGTFMIACVLYGTMFSQVPPLVLPDDAAQLWQNARAMNPHGGEALRLPNKDELEYLREVADRACQAQAMNASL